MTKASEKEDDTQVLTTTTEASDDEVEETMHPIESLQRRKRGLRVLATTTVASVE